ncbi:MAG: hypothetical protein M3256_01415 [Actinomycetota bacterium]|nr:hypothetical protein [Actinomycetota bacterium]
MSEHVREAADRHWEWDVTHPELAGEIDPQEPDAVPLGVRIYGLLQVKSTPGGPATADFLCYGMREILTEYRINGVV